MGELILATLGTAAAVILYELFIVPIIERKRRERHDKGRS
jgi:hypothetical protein